MSQSNVTPAPAATVSVATFQKSRFLYYFKRDKVAMASFTVFMMFLVLALAAPILAPTDPYDPTSIDIMDSELPPSWMEDGDERFVLGTDEQGRDILSTILYGSRLSLTIGFLAVGLQLVLESSLVCLRVTSAAVLIASTVC